MEVKNIIDEIAKADPEVYDKLDTRRDAMKQFARISGKVALAAVPLALGSMLNKAYAGPSNTVVLDVLNYALTLEYLEAEFYTTGLASGTLTIPSAPALGALTKIRDDENAHVKFLKAAITAVGGSSAVATKPTFDFSGGKGSGNGPFKNAFSDYGLFLAVAQTFEDTGVRAYKGRAAEIVGGGDYLEAALNIHSVEARHASHIRQMRRALGANVKPWITGKDSGIGAIVQASYNGEEAKTQAGVNIVNIGNTGVKGDAATEAFDEPLTKQQVLDIVSIFIVP